MTTPFDTVRGEKQACREAFVAAIADRIPRPADFFLLPSENAYDAYLLWRHWPLARIEGIERDPGLFDQIRTEHGRLKMHHGTIGGFVRTMMSRDRELKAPAFDAAFLDYMGPMTPQHVADICAFVEHLSKSRFVLALTFLKATRGARDSVEPFVRARAVLTEEEEFAEWPLPNTAENLAGALCQSIERGYSSPGRPSTRALADQLRSLDILDARTYRATDTSSAMHFVVLGLARF